MIGFPIAMSTPVAFGAQTGAIGALTDLNSLMCPGGSAMLVESIGVSFLDVSWWIVDHEWDLKIGQAQLTRGFMPMRACTREDAPDLGSGCGELVWNFPRPCYVPKGRAIHPQIKSNSTRVTAATIFVRGRKLPDNYPVPTTTMVPYATAFVSPVLSTAVALTDPRLAVFKTGAADLANPFNAPLNVQRFIGAAQDGSGTSDRRFIQIGFAAGSYFPLVQLFDQSGQPISREPIRLAELCQATFRAWDIPFVLPPRARIYASIDLTHPAFLQGGNYQMMLGLVGWREVPVSEVW